MLFILLLLSIVGVSLVAYAYMPVVVFITTVVAMASTVIEKALARLLARAFFVVKGFIIAVITTAKDAILITYDIFAFKTKASVVVVIFVATVEKTFAAKKAKDFAKVISEFFSDVILTAKDAIIIVCDIFAKKAKMTKAAFFSFVKERKEKAVFTVKVNVAVVAGSILIVYDNLVANVKRLVIVIKKAIAKKVDTLMDVINASAVVVLSVISLFERTMDKVDSAIAKKVEAKRASNVVKVEKWSIRILAKAFAIAEFIDKILVEKPENNNIDGFDGFDEIKIKIKKVDVAKKVTETLSFVFLPFLLGRKINELRVKEWEVNLKKWKEELERN